MVGSVLLERMQAEKDFDGSFEPIFFSTSGAGSLGPDVGFGSKPLADAADLDLLCTMQVVVSCQGGDYTKEVHPKLRSRSWEGLWIDAASTLRMEGNAVIVLDPINNALIRKALDDGCKDFIGGNCTVSLLLLALGGLFEKGWVEWVSSMTYQAASGAGAKNMRELVKQMRAIGSSASSEVLDNDATAVLELDRAVTSTLRSAEFPTEEFGAPLAGSLIPWIDKAMENGQTKEEWKAGAEANKIMGLTGEKVIPMDGLCVRVGSMRCHSQAVTVKLSKDVPMEEIEEAISNHNEWVKLVPNNKADTLKQLSPANVSGTLEIPVGRLRKMSMGPEYLAAFTVGDQLLWGAAEPLRRMLRIYLEHRKQ